MTLKSFWVGGKEGQAQLSLGYDKESTEYLLKLLFKNFWSITVFA